MKQRSLQRELYIWVIVSTVILTVLGGAIAGFLAFQQARELQDNTLKEIAFLVRSGQSDFSELHNRILEKRVVKARHDRDDDVEDTTIIIHELGAHGPLQGWPSNIQDGLHTIEFGDEEWRSLIITHKDGQRRFSIAQPTELRDEIALGSATSALLPILTLVSILLILIHVIVRRQFQSVANLAASLDQQDGSQLQRLTERNVPLEIRPFVYSINALMLRVQSVMQKQQRFIADAAHELRTPIAALSLQAENLKQAKDAVDLETRQGKLQQGFDRLGKLVGQLLDLARLQSGGVREYQTVDLNEVVKTAVADLFPLADDAAIDLGVIRQEKHVLLHDQNGRLGQLVQNAIGNAIHYTPAQGTVDISLFKRRDKAVLLVEDTGIGIPEDELQQVMQPFYRVQGSEKPGNGLGLTISHEIAECLNGQITLSNREGGGLCFQYEQPLVNEGDDLALIN